MKKVACLALVGALGLFGCGGGGGDDDDDDIVFYDAGGDPGDPDAAGGECNPVSQSGCAAGEKCAFIVDQLDPLIGHIGCTADGTDAVGAACTEAAAVNTSDSCAKGGECYNGLCHEICSTVNDQCTDGVCQTFVDGSGNPLPTEICLFSCDPLLQDCTGEGEGCFIAREAVCVRAGSAVTGDPCQNANGCVKGNICLGDPGVCRLMCGTIEEMWADDGADPPALTWPTCCGNAAGDCATATLACATPNNMCWLIGDGSGGVLNVGFCQSDTDSSGGTAPETWTCDCNSGAAEKCALDNP
jgi:hypothetical protein